MTNWTKGHWSWNISDDGWHQSLIAPSGKVLTANIYGDIVVSDEDAALIAAAPELYEALEAIVNELMHDCPSNLKPELRDAIAALSKARGEAQ